MTPEQKKPLAQALDLDVAFQKIVAAIGAHIHKNPAPKIEWIEAQITEAEKLVTEWLNIAEQVRERYYFQNSTVVNYFAASLKMELEGLQRFPARVRLRLEEGVVPEFKHENAEALFHYAPETHMSEATRKLAEMVGVSLE